MTLRSLIFPAWCLFWALSILLGVIIKGEHLL